jgi:hypothetical protein
MRFALPLALVASTLAALPAAAADSPDGAAEFLAAAPRVHDMWHVDWTTAAANSLGPPARSAALNLDDVIVPDDAGQGRHAAAFEYSDEYHTRAKIHKYASFAMLPLFVTEGALGAALYNNTSSGAKTAHQAVGAAIMGLFALNTVTGVWNMWEARADPNARKKRLIHGLLMLAADIGFLDTLATGPHSGRLSTILNYEASKATHRNVAVVSISLATTSYLMMLFGGH